jgi:hypothetical protein
LKREVFEIKRAVELEIEMDAKRRAAIGDGKLLHDFLPPQPLGDHGTSPFGLSSERGGVTAGRATIMSASGAVTFYRRMAVP